MSDSKSQKEGTPGKAGANVGSLDGRTKAQVEADTLASVNTVLVRDPNGPVKQRWPSYRDPEPPHKMIYVDMLFKEVQVPHEEVIFYTHGVLMDRNVSHSDTVVIGKERRAHVFDRVYTHNGKIFRRCAWIPNKVERAGILFEKKINRQTKRPVAVLKKFGATEDPKYAIVGGGETDYRDLRRIFERSFIRRQRDQVDDELDRFQYEAIGPIEQESTDANPAG